MKILYRIDRKAGRKAYNALHLVKNIKSPHLVPIHAFWLKDENGNILDDDVAPEFGMESSGDSVVPENVGLTDTMVPGHDTRRTICGRPPAPLLVPRN